MMRLLSSAYPIELARPAERRVIIWFFILWIHFMDINLQHRTYNFLVILMAPIWLAACAVAHTPGELKKEPPIFLAFQGEPSKVVECLAPELDKITPFSFPTDETRPTTLRQLGGTTQIIGMDEIIVLYLVELTKGLKGTDGVAFLNSSYSRIRPQLEQAVVKCNGRVSDTNTTY
jgi:hypothetical protein